MPRQYICKTHSCLLELVRKYLQCSDRDWPYCRNLQAELNLFLRRKVKHNSPPKRCTVQVRRNIRKHSWTIKLVFHNWEQQQLQYLNQNTRDPQGDQPAAQKSEAGDNYCEEYQWSRSGSSFHLDTQLPWQYIPHKVHTHLVYCLVLQYEDRSTRGLTHATFAFQTVFNKKLFLQVKF